MRGLLVPSAHRGVNVSLTRMRVEILLAYPGQRVYRSASFLDVGYFLRFPVERPMKQHSLRLR